MATYDTKGIMGAQLQLLAIQALRESALISKDIVCGAANTYPVRVIATIYSKGSAFNAHEAYSLTLHIYSEGGETEEGILKIGYTSGASATDNGKLSAAWLCRSENLSVAAVRVGVVRNSTGIGLFVLHTVPHTDYYLSFTPISKSKYGTWNLFSTRNNDGPRYSSMTDAETQLAAAFDATKTAFDEATYSMDNSFVDADTYDSCAHQIGVQLRYYANVRLPTNIICDTPGSTPPMNFLCLSQFTQSKSYRFELRYPMANNVFLYNNLGFEVTVYYPSTQGGNVESALPNDESYTMNGTSVREKCCSAWATLIGRILYISYGY